jgi:glycine oxidase
VLSIGIAGAGLLGRLLAWQLGRLGHSVAVFDPAAGPAPMFGGGAQRAAAFTAAGMLCPLAELDNADPATAVLGWRSIARWRTFVAQLPDAPFFSERGSLLLAHRQDRAAADRVLARVAHGMQSPAWQAAGVSDKPSSLSMAQLAALEPCVQGAAHAWLLPGEAQIDAVTTMAALHADAKNVRAVDCTRLCAHRHRGAAF